LGRLFRSYPKQKTHAAGPPASNIVIYSGDRHRRNYDYVFHTLGFQEISRQSSDFPQDKTNQCISAKKLFPIFDTIKHLKQRAEKKL
jgi:hypothetical protein